MVLPNDHSFLFVFKTLQKEFHQQCDVIYMQYLAKKMTPAHQPVSLEKMAANLIQPLHTPTENAKKNQKSIDHTRYNGFAH